MSTLSLIIFMSVASYIKVTPIQIETIEEAPLNHFQLIGSHNSYKKTLNADVKQKLNELDTNLVSKIDYGHAPITEQLNSGVRHLEIDVLKDPKGNLYQVPWANLVSKAPLFNKQEQQQLNTAGFKVMHIPDIDVQSHCVLFSQCLNTLKTWSDANPKHFPIVVMLNVKENRSSVVSGNAVLPFNADDYQLLDQEIKDSLQQRLFAPDDLRQGARTLQQSALELGWPDVSKLAGKFIFLFDGNKKQNALYKLNRPSLKNASMFANYSESEPEAAFMIINNPIKHMDKIQRLVASGYMVRTRADAKLTATNSQRHAQFMAAKQSGAQIISSDFIPSSPQQVRLNYVVLFDDNQLVRSNPFFYSERLY